MALDEKLHYISTIIFSSYENFSGQGTGFFFAVTDQTDRVNDKIVNNRITKLFLVTNRHVLLRKYDDKEEIPRSLSFRIRFNNIYGGKIIWRDIILNKAELLEKTLVHNNTEIDVVLIDIKDKITQITNAEPNLMWSCITNLNFPTNTSNIEITDSIVTIGYPKGFFDEYNQFPIVKTGIIASKWKAKFNNKDYFLIDSKLFPGSSGSLVISKPSHLKFTGENLYHNPIKDFTFLGIYSGEPYIQVEEEIDNRMIKRKYDFNLGTVWYFYLLDEIILQNTTLG